MGTVVSILPFEGTYSVPNKGKGSYKSKPVESVGSKYTMVLDRSLHHITAKTGLTSLSFSGSTRENVPFSDMTLL